VAFLQDGAALSTEINLVHKLAILCLVPLLACGTDYGTNPSRTVASITVALSNSELEMGQTDTAVATARDQYGVSIDAGVVTYSSTFPEVATVNPTTGQVHAVASGNAQIIATVGATSARETITVSPPPILVNEVNPDGDLPGGWVELFNPDARAVDVAGWTITSSDAAHSFTIPAGATIASGDYLAVNEVTLPSGLNATDAVHLYNKYGVQSDAYGWVGNTPGTAYARCPDGFGDFVSTSTPTRKATNVCQ
jgi:hypothetical protein